MHPRDAQPHAEREPVAWREQALALFAKIYNVIDNEDNFEPLDEAIACAKEGIALLSTASPADEMQALRAAFRNADELDWQHLDKLLGHSGHGKFWRAVFAEVRSALQGEPQ